MSTSDKILSIQNNTLELISNFIDDLVKLCESDIERLFISSMLNYLFESKFHEKPSLYFSGFNNHNWDFSDFERILDEKHGPIFSEAEISEFEKKGYKLFGCDYIKTIGIKMIDVKGYPFIEENNLSTEYNIFPQYEVEYENKYRLDFAIICDHFKNGKKYKTSKIAIECDGFDYHSTKESLSRDKKRDREFTKNGWKVFRYTGSDIYKFDSGKVVDELFSDIRKLSIQ